ncbi:hypothetical protein ACFPTO_03950 [Paraburkholderia denitrificans]|uniref:Uncharacterized protein n=1 Tax=Paraburkholderia denitrificans TaxID=694025 RepID=A0ABW0J4J4_9BURK
MQTNEVLEYRGCEIRPTVTPTASGRYSAAVLVTDRDGETRTLGVEGDFAGPQEARDGAMELAIAWIQQRPVISDRHVRRT